MNSANKLNFMTLILFVTFRYVVNNREYSLYMCNVTGTDGESLVCEGIEYKPLPFTLKGISDALTGKANATLTIDNGERMFSRFLKTQVSFERGEVEVFQINLEHLELEHPPKIFNHKFKIDQTTEFTSEKATFKLTSIKDFNVEIPPFVLSKICCYSLGDKNCKYAGADTKCKKTLEACKAKNNESNFGGLTYEDL